MSGPPFDPIETTPPPPHNFKTYLGDGAFVDVGNYASEVILTTEDGQSVQNRVVLGPTEVSVLLRWFNHREARWKAEASQREEKGK